MSEADTPSPTPKLNVAELTPSVLVGLVSGLIVSIGAISMAGLIFNGDLYVFMSQGIGYMLVASILAGLIYSFFTSFPFSINLLQGTAPALLGIEVLAITAGMWGQYSEQEILLTVVATIFLTTVSASALAFFLGRLNLGSLVRYMPYPVMGGFLAGSGWTLFAGGFSFIAGRPLALAQLGALVQFDSLIRWLPGVLFAFTMFFVLQRVQHFMTMPSLIIGGFALFYLAVFASGNTLAAASADGWLLGPFPQAPRFEFPLFQMFGSAQWGLVLGRVFSLGSIILISLISLLLNVSGIDIAVKEDVDLNRELRTAGLTDLFVGLVGGSSTYPAVSLSTLNYKMSANGRLTAIISALVPGFFLLIGAPLLPFLPRVVLGSILLYFGISFVYDWAIITYNKLPLFEYGIILVITVVMNTVGLLEGVGLGLTLAILLFVINYSRIDVIKHNLNGSTYRSTVDRPLVYQQLLGDHGVWLYILELQGYIFFGTANRLYENVIRRVAEDQDDELRFLVFDFRQVVGMDASALMEFKKTRNLAASKDIRLVFTHMTPEMVQLFAAEGFDVAEEGGLLCFEDLDRGVEWCEDRQLDKYVESGIIPHRGAAAKDINVSTEGERGKQLSALLDFLGEREQVINIPLVKTLSKYLELQEYQPGELIIRQGENTRCLYFIEAGEATAFLEDEERKGVRLRKMQPGAVVGEVSYYRRSPASASVRAETPCRVYVLSGENIKKLNAEEPTLSQELHQYMAELLSYRLATSTNTIRALMD